MKRLLFLLLCTAEYTYGAASSSSDSRNNKPGTVQTITPITQEVRQRLALQKRSKNRRTHNSTENAVCSSIKNTSIAPGSSSQNTSALKSFLTKAPEARAASSTEGSLQAPPSLPSAIETPLAIKKAQDYYEQMLKQHNAAICYHALLDTELKNLIKQNQSKKASDYSDKKKGIIDAQNTVDTTKCALKRAKNALQDAKAAHIIAQRFPPNSKAFCDLKHAEYLTTLEVAAENNRMIKAQAEAEDKAFSEYFVGAKALAYGFMYTVCFPFSIGLNLIDQKRQKELPAIIQTKTNQALQAYNQARQAFSPAAYFAEKKTEYDEAAADLQKLKEEKDRTLASIKLLSRTHLKDASLITAQEKADKIKADYKKAEQAVQAKLLAKNQAESKLSAVPQPLNVSPNEAVLQSIFQTAHAPGTYEYYMQCKIRFLGALNLYESIEREIATRNAEIVKKWFYQQVGLIPEALAFSSYLSCIFNLKERAQATMNTAMASLNRKSIATQSLFRSSFIEKVDVLQNCIEHYLHPILHGHAEQIPESLVGKVWHAVTKSVGELQKLQIKEAYCTIQQMTNDTGITKHAVDAAIEGITLTTAIHLGNPAVAACTRKFLEKTTRWLTTTSTEKNPIPGATSSNAMLDARTGKAPNFSSRWHPEKECPHGIERCPLIGLNSKEILVSIKTFRNNITRYEQEKKLPYFPRTQDVHRICDILETAIIGIYETNIKSALSKAACEDKKLENTVKIIKALASLPTTFPNIDKTLKENMAQLDAQLAQNTTHEKNAIYSVLRQLRRNTLRYDYGHRDNDTGVNFVVIGPTGVGKTHFVEQLRMNLNIPILQMTIEELLNFNKKITVDDLLRYGSLSPLEQQITSLPKDSSSLLIIIHMDEGCKHPNITNSQLKRELCQFKNIFLPYLHITLPTKLNLILTCNNADFLEHDEALKGRFIILRMNALTVERKINRLLPKVIAYFENNPELKNQSKNLDFRQITEEYVKFDPDTNMRDLEKNLSCIVDYFTRGKEIEAGNVHLFPAEQRYEYKETFNEFLLSVFKPNNSTNAQPNNEIETRHQVPSAIPTCSSHNTNLSDSEEPSVEDCQNNLFNQIVFAESSSDDEFNSPTEPSTDYEPSSSCSEDSYNDHDTE